MRLRPAAALLAATLGFVALPAAAQPSFLCAKARSWVEKTVCASAPLSDLDLQLAVAYARMLKVVSGQARATLEDEQRRWWARRDECRKAADPSSCLEERYRHQIVALESRPDYPGEAQARTVELPPESIATAGRGWTRELSRYRRAIAACREESPAPLGKVLAAWPGAQPDTVTLRVVDWELREYVCTAHAGGHKVVAFAARAEGEALPPAGPVYHLGTKKPAGCPQATQVLDVNGKAAGWISDADC